MSVKMSRRIRAVLIPAAVFQSVIFGGAYGTGREVAEYISAYGPSGGLYALAAIAVMFAIVLALSFEVARVLSAYDYRSFIGGLIGRGGFIYELLLVISIPLVLAVNGSAAAAIMHDQFRLPASFGVLIAFGMAIVFNYLGRKAVERSLLVLASGLVMVLVITGGVATVSGAESIRLAFESAEAIPGWPMSALQYCLYNVAIVPVILYCARDLRSSGESLTCGIVAGIAAVFPALVFHVTFMAAYPQILDQAIPVYTILEQHASPILFWTYVVVLFCMIFSTVVGLLHGVNERLDAWHIEKFGTPVARAWHAITVTLVMLASILLSKFGITSLIANGYGTLAWLFLLVFVLPLVLRGPFLVSRKQ